MKYIKYTPTYAQERLQLIPLAISEGINRTPAAVLGQGPLDINKGRVDALVKAFGILIGELAENECLDAKQVARIGNIGYGASFVEDTPAKTL